MAILAIDSGGTKISMALCMVDEGGVHIERWVRYLAQDYNGFDEVIDAFLGKDAPRVQAVSLGIAGPIENGRVHLTNLDWHIDAAQIRTKLDCSNVYMLNDLEAHGYGLLQIPKTSLVILRPGKRKTGNKALIAAGTGLGECILFRHKDKYVPSASEGGHSSFSPTNDLEVELLKYAWQRYKHVSHERVVSGTFAFELIFNFLKDTGKYTVPKELKNANLPSNDYGPVVQKLAESGVEIAAKTMELFVHLFGSEAGNLALKAMATGGIYLGGGIPPKLFSWYERGGFTDAFDQKGRFKELLEQIPIYVIIDDCNALRGAAYYAHQQLAGV